MKKKIVLICIIIILVAGTILFIMHQNQSKNTPEDVLNTYMSYIGQKNYSGMYSLLNEETKSRVSEEDFTTRNKNIYEGIEVQNLNINIVKTDNKDDNVEIVYSTKMDTMAGEISFPNTATLTKNEDKMYELSWNSTMIFPDLKDEYKVRVSTLTAKRGTIYDRNDIAIAEDGIASQIGLVPGKINAETKEADIEKIANLLEISVDTINSALSASYVKDDTFVPLKTVLKTQQDLKNATLEVKGIKIIDVTQRIYPYQEVTGALLGYIQTIGEEELKEKQTEGYTSSSKIGKEGLERSFERKLHAQNGAEIYIEDENGNKTKTLAKIEAKNGENIKLTIDVVKQQNAYNQFKEDKSACVMMNPYTGEILALVTTPTYDSNDFTLGMTNEKWQSLTQNPDNPLYNRYLASYAPGSSFKPIVGAIGLNTGSFTADEDFGTSGTKWQNSSSWGDFYITTLTTYSGKANLQNALIYSDNIYFAKAALKIGAENMKTNLQKLGFAKEIEFVQSITKSTYSNTDSFINETALANTGYGQAEVLVNPIHAGMMYSSFVNDGNMIMPYIEYKENVKPTYYQEGVFSKEVAQTIRQDLVQVVENADGTAHGLKLNGKTIAAKTGTAEVKASKDDTEGREIGWLNSFNVGESEKNSLLIISMVEDVQDKGGSHYLIPKVKNLY